MNPQYTPFPITTNPPRVKTTVSDHSSPENSTVDPSLSKVNATSQSLSTTSVPAKPNVPSDTLPVLPISNPEPGSPSTHDNNSPHDLPSTTTTEAPSTTTTLSSTTSRFVPSIEYSPIPAADFDKSYDDYVLDYFYYDDLNRVLSTADQDEGYPAQVFQIDRVVTPTSDTRRVSAAPFRIAEPGVTSDSTMTAQDQTQTSSTPAVPPATTSPTTTTLQFTSVTEEVSNLPKDDVLPSSGENMVPEQVWDSNFFILHSVLLLLKLLTILLFIYLLIIILCY